MHDQGPAWLFSFVDLAFLLLIAMTQVGVDTNGISLELGELVVPRVHSGSTLDLPADAERRWQLRVHPPEAEGKSPYELVRPDGADPLETEPRLVMEALRERLATLHAANEKKPVLAPHADSRTQDMLDAATMLEELWPTRRRATVAPIFSRG